VSRFLTRLCVNLIDEFSGVWELAAPLRYQSNELMDIVTVPMGFRTDFASVPRILGIYDLEGGKCNQAAVVHDFLYSVGCMNFAKITRAQADAVLREAIVASGYSAATAAIFYAAVRVGGASHWRAPNQPQIPRIASYMEAGGGLA
jgi:hypothetical protein